MRKNLFNVLPVFVICSIINCDDGKPCDIRTLRYLKGFSRSIGFYINLKEGKIVTDKSLNESESLILVAYQKSAFNTIENLHTIQISEADWLKNGNKDIKKSFISWAFSLASTKPEVLFFLLDASEGPYQKEFSFPHLLLYPQSLLAEAIAAKEVAAIKLIVDYKISRRINANTDELSQILNQDVYNYVVQEETIDSTKTIQQILDDLIDENLKSEILSILSRFGGAS